MRGVGGRSGRWLVVGVLVAGLAVAVAACGSSAAQVTVTLPGKPSRAQLVRVTPARPSVRQLVLSAYEGYWQATNQAIDSRNAASAKAILAGYIPASAVPVLVNGMRAMWRHDEITFGGPVFHIMGVQVTGHRTAAVHDCIDLSHTGFQDSQTGQIVGGLGLSHDYLITTLELEHGRWLVTGAIPVVQACA